MCAIDICCASYVSKANNDKYIGVHVLKTEGNCYPIECIQ